MNKRPVISVVLNLHVPFICRSGASWSPEERLFFAALSETYLPLLEALDRLDADHIPFRLALSLSPSLCHLLSDESLLQRYVEFTDRQIEFGLREIERTARDPQVQKLSRFFYDKVVDRRILFTERYEGNILKIFDLYQKKGKVELLTTAATYAFLPFYTACAGAVQAQLEVASSSHRRFFSINPQGFWLPELGWNEELDEQLRAYGFSYTILDTHGFLLGTPPPARGSFFPVKTPSGVLLLSRDYYAARELAEPGTGFSCDPWYQDRREDVGYELPPEAVKPFLGPGGVRTRTGFTYRRQGEPQAPGAAPKPLYEPEQAALRAREHARLFLENRISRFNLAKEYMDETAVSLCACDADTFGRGWYEGSLFIEALFREGVKNGEIQFMNPVEYLYKQPPHTYATMVPEFSSWGGNGYAETWLDAANDWIYRHIIRSLERMMELAERFADDTGLKERALNQAAREILLAQASDWAKTLSKGESPEYARSQIEGALRNFTTIYEALGSNYISTEWLTNLERQHNIFPHINYRVFRRKQ
jgi:1,4-alpha-glucan branching enzyme